MANRSPASVSRRRFLGQSLAAAAVVPLAPSLASPVAARAVDHAADGTTAPFSYRSLTASEAAFTEALVNARCPADALTPDGVTSGLAAFIDAHLAGDSEASPGQRALFREGMMAANAACLSLHGVPFAALPADRARAFLRDLAAGEVPSSYPLASWSADVVDPVLTQACFSGAVYAQHDGRMFWKLFG